MEDDRLLQHQIRLKASYTGRINGDIWQGDAIEFMRSLEPASAAIVFLDPPFNLNKLYSTEHPRLDRRPEREYALWLEEVVRQASRLLVKGGALYLYHLPVWAMRMAAVLDSRLSFRHWIAVSMKNGFVRGRRLYPAHYGLLFFTNGEPSTFSRPKLRPQICRSCGEYTKDYGGYRHIIEEKGINLSDIWDDTSPVRHPSKKNRHGNELPAVILDRVLAISGMPNQLYVDPFAGAGTGLVAAATVNMRFAGCDIVQENCESIMRRLNEL